MSVVDLVPEGASPPPEPPPRDYGGTRTVGDKFAIEGDVKIRARIEACRQGMIQLEALRSKHHRLMQEMRGRLPPIPGCADVQTRIKKTTAVCLDRTSLQSVDSGVSSMSQTIPSTRCSSPSVSHRSSVSCDSGCSSVFSNELNSTQSIMPYSTYRKLSIEERYKELPASPTKEELFSHQVPIVATTIASTTSLRSEGVARAWRKQQQRPRSMYDRNTDQNARDSLLDSASFIQITPPPVHRKIGVVTQQQATRPPLTSIRFAVNVSPQIHRPLRTAQKPDITKVANVENADIIFHASRIFVDRSPPADRRPRPNSMFESNGNKLDEPLYATPARVLVREHQSNAPQNSPAVLRRSAFTSVVSRIVPTISTDHVVRATKGRVFERVWKESEGL